MISVYPFGSGDSYTAAYAVSASFATSASFIAYVQSASFAATVLYPQTGDTGKSVCLLTKEQYAEMITLNKIEVCVFS